MEIHYSNSINTINYEQVESLFFFNNRQHVYYSEIVEAVDKYGNPLIIRKNDTLRIILDKIENCKSLFLSLGPKLIGIILYFELDNELIIAHIALDTHYLDDVNIELVVIMNSIFKKIKSIAKENVNIKFILLPYQKKRFKVN